MTVPITALAGSALGTGDMVVSKRSRATVPLACTVSVRNRLKPDHLGQTLPVGKPREVNSHFYASVSQL